MNDSERKRDYKNLVVEIALSKSASSGEDYEKAIPAAMEEARIKMGLTKQDFIKMF